MIRLAVLLGTALLSTTPAWAEPPSSYGCSHLEEAAPTPYIEGRHGVFFRLALDLRMRHPMSDGSIALLAELSEALGLRGTTLVFVPLPGKGLAMPRYLPESAGDYGFDPAIATAAYEDVLARLRAAGVVAVDALGPLQDLPDGTMAFIPTDHHWTSNGARAVAEEVARVMHELPAYAGLESAEHKTYSLGLQDLPSPYRREIQAMCRDTVPRSATEAWETEVTQAPLGGGGGIFAAEAAGPPVVLVGTSMSRTESFNFDGFLADAADLDVLNYAVTGGNQYGAMIAYMTSQEFQDAPPTFLVWENPIYNNLAEFGELPLRELIAAAADQCVPVETVRADDHTLVADLPLDGLSSDSYVRADAGAANGRAIHIGFITKDGRELNGTIERTQRIGPSRRFYQYVEPFWEPGISRIQVRFDRPVQDDATLALCTNKETAS
ncbi:hypothetical protein FHG66_07745 [Rubellimicrobium rubrum]|uniref:AlgX/AlgJ SGNH hydrolase-like domain-containing protein n=1 Tax=Rubellimicrobium rubrum TaxID=2585369 RepID=A0A5C4MZJ2_9RHOB|nr:hypothetical protein [Rubellimicrobium rubrum]TNC50853.1 hypothetical protein FHG66_07745 [Rubellimicrobium rubrum]